MKIVFKTFIASILLINVWSCNANSKSKSNITAHHEVKTKTTEQFIKVALLLDTSNSMDGLIDQAKAQLWEIVNELSYAKCNNDRPSLKIALYEYGNDGLNAEKGYIRKVIDFSSDLDDISKELFSLTTNGGNEFCGHVIQTSLDQLKWGNNPDDLKLIFIAGNEPFTQGEVSYKTATTNANEKDVTVNTIFCGDYQEGIVSYWKEGANLTRGNYMAINHNQATANIPSPYDDDILILNQQLNKTYIYYGSNGSSKMALQEEQDSKAQGYSKANAVSRTVSKSSHLYKNSSWDLVDAVEIESLDLDKIKNDELPKELRGKSKEEIIAFLKTKKEERTSINKKIQELNKKRKAFISISQSKNDNGLESAMIKAIKTQAKKKNYKWE